MLFEGFQPSGNWENVLFVAAKSYSKFIQACHSVLWTFLGYFWAFQLERMSNGSSTAHWCKEVIEQAVPTSGLNIAVPPPAPPSFGKQSGPNTVNNVSSPIASMAMNTSGINPQYLQLYQQLYAPKPVSVAER